MTLKNQLWTHESSPQNSNMTGRTILIGTCVVGSLVGLGFLANYVYGGEQEKSGKDNPAREPERDSHNSYDRTRRNRPVRNRRPRPETQPERKINMVEVKENKTPIADEFPLRLGSKGERVERLQVWLMRNYGWTGKITGEFDEKTEGLLKKFLKRTELDEATYFKMKMEKPVYEQIIMR